ncbi:fluoride efflux transporter FluC [Lacticaseibacillus baoqingensis]|uniref:Fluoride-specific ion channel FluC n=1 Tax=Lacticaseibacillus baoqingensis TaxID=2486013 RepID=A0ABW4E7D2_9LACO|nr:CrcB family protein [Lacticaseibacillus baoqingensis]
MVIAVALGAGVGACLRYLITLGLKPLSPHWPLATIVINTLGAGLAGWFTAMAVQGLAAGWWLTGMCGGLTTFSTFMVEAVTLAQNRRWLAAICYFLGTIGLGVAAFALGRGLTP